MPRNKSQLPIATDCFGCGVCCLHMGYPAYMLTENADSSDVGLDQDIASLNDDQYWNRMPAELKAELEAYIATYDKGDAVFDGPCVWLDKDTMLCGHHEYRPRVCRDFKIGKKKCQEWREHFRDRILKSSDAQQDLG